MEWHISNFALLILYITELSNRYATEPKKEPLVQNTGPLWHELVIE